MLSVLREDSQENIFQVRHKLYCRSSKEKGGWGQKKNFKQGHQTLLLSCGCTLHFVQAGQKNKNVGMWKHFRGSTFVSVAMENKIKNFSNFSWDKMQIENLTLETWEVLDSRGHSPGMNSSSRPCCFTPGK